MSNQQNALEAMLAQYEANNKSKYTPSEGAKVYDLKNYFNTFIKESVNSGTKTVRILPMQDGSTPFVEFHGHKRQVDGEWKTFACLQHEKKEACPFCEARAALLATGKEADKELAKSYGSRMMYIVKVIDRDNEEDGVKFWRFNHDYRHEGIYDKIIGVLNAIKKDVTNPETGRDLLITINRNQNKIPVVSAVASLDPSVLSLDAAQAEAWLTDTKTWEDVYAVKTYDFLKLIVKGETPVWSKEENKFVAKSSQTEENVAANKLEAELTMGVENVKTNIMEATEKVAETVEVNDEGSTDDLPF